MSTPPANIINLTYQRELLPFNDRVLTGSPVYHVPSAYDCSVRCNNLFSRCGGFTYKEANPLIPGDRSACWLRPPGGIWRNDPICDSNPALCQGWTKLPSVSTVAFLKAPKTFASGTALAGYPVSDRVANAYDCSQRCLNAGDCSAFTFKQKDPAVNGDNRMCWLIMGRYTWVDSNLCTSKEGFQLCQGWMRRTSSINPDSNLFTRASLPFGDGGTVAGYPTYNTVKTPKECSQRCIDDVNCWGFTFKQRDPDLQNDFTYCSLKFKGTIWRDDGLCYSAYGIPLCQGWSKKNMSIGFTKAPFPFSDGPTVPGYPTYDLIATVERCQQKCLESNECYSFTFKQKNAGLQKDFNMCWLKGQGATWRDDGMCQSPLGSQLCQSWIKTSGNFGSPASLPPTGVADDASIF